jgi:agarase
VSTFPPFLPEVADGAAQAMAYGAYMDGVLGLPFVVGAHWFQWMDQPVEGRADGENQLIGFVDIDDNLNQPLADEVARVNAEIIERRLRAR